jgi:aminoglycoside/choline kinase family phosphotransferase
VEAEKRKKEEDEAARVALDAKRHQQELAGTKVQQKMISASKRDKAMQRKAATKRLLQEAKNDAEFTRHMAAIKAKQNVAKVRGIFFRLRVLRAILRFGAHSRLSTRPRCIETGGGGQ